MLTAALEPRIRAAVVAGALNLMQERIQGRYSCGAQVIPGLLQYGDVPEISSLIAPRHCVWEIGSRDGLIKPDWAQQALTRNPDTGNEIFYEFNAAGYAIHSWQLGTLRILLQHGSTLSEEDQRHILRISRNDQQLLNELMAIQRA